MATCTKCGKTNYEGVKYCTACGTTLSVSQSNYEDENEEEALTTSNNTNSGNSFSETSEKPKGRGIDPKILYIIAGVIILGILIVLFKWFISQKDDFKVDFIPEPDKNVYTGQPVIFTDRTQNAKSWEWDFGDNSEIAGVNKVETHTFEVEGIYWVKLTINGKYTDSVQITVTRKPLPGDDLEDIKVHISGPIKVKVDEYVTYTDNTPDADAWQWMMMETGEIDSREKSIKYKFKTPGWKTIRVKNNKARNFGTLKIKVAAIPPPVLPGVKPHVASETEIQRNLQAVADGKMDYLKFVKDYLCSDKTIPIIKNGKKFKDFYMYSMDFEFNPGQKILKVQITRNSDNCPIQMEVTSK